MKSLVESIRTVPKKQLMSQTGFQCFAWFQRESNNYQQQRRRLFHHLRSETTNILSDMHAVVAGAPGYVPVSNYTTYVKFAPDQQVTERHAGTLVAERTKRREFFYGIELTGLKNGSPLTVDFKAFLPTLPTFVSMVWLGMEYWNIEPVANVHTLSLAKHMEPHIAVMPHVSLYRMSQERFEQFLALNFSNLLAVRGDTIYDGQFFTSTQQMVAHARKVRGNEISICVAGHPEGQARGPKGELDTEADMRHLKEKIDAGADFIITQFCYCPELIVQFIKNCRTAGITVPIMVGVVVPDSIVSYELMTKIANIHLPADLQAVVNKNPDNAKNFFINLAVRTIEHVLASDVGVYGIQFYTMNRFPSVLEVICKLRDRNILKNLPPIESCDN